MKEKIIEILNKYGNHIYIDNLIPVEKVENAIINYPIDRTDKVLGLIDTTVFGSAKNGMAITEKGIYFKNDWTTHTIKNFLSWKELTKNNIRKGSMFCILLANKCEFNISGASDINRDILINLLNEIINLFDISKNDNDIENTSNTNPNNNIDEQYVHILVNLIALCIVTDGEIEDSEIEMANAIIENDDLIKEKDYAINILGESIENLLAVKEKSSTIFKLKSLSITSKVLEMKDKFQKDKILIVLEGMLESVDKDNQGQTKILIDKIKEKL